MRKKVGIVKRMSCLLLIFLLSINSFAAIVSDNDGSAFITKSEFDALKSSFQAQIDSYNQSIDSKIDGAIASYLAGIKLSSEFEQKTLFKNYIENEYFYDDDMVGYIQFLKRNDTVKNEKTWAPFSIKLTSLRIAWKNDATWANKATIGEFCLQPSLSSGLSTRYVVDGGDYLCYTTGYQCLISFYLGGSRGDGSGTQVLFPPEFQWSKTSKMAVTWNKFNKNLWGYSEETSVRNVYCYYGMISQVIDRIDLTDTADTKLYGKRNTIVTPWKTNSGLASGARELCADLSRENVSYHNGNTTSGSAAFFSVGVSTSSPYVARGTISNNWLGKTSSSYNYDYRTEYGYNAMTNAFRNYANDGDFSWYTLQNLCFDGIFSDINLMDYPAKFAKQVDSANTKMSYGLKIFTSDNTGVARLNVTTKNKGRVIVYASDTGDTDWAGLKTEYLNGTIDSKFSFNDGETKDIEFNVTKNMVYWVVGVPDTAETIGIKINGCKVLVDS